MTPITSSVEYQEKVVDASFEKPTVVVFTSPTCGPCKQLKPKLEALGVEILVVDAGTHREIAVEQFVRAAPTTRIYKDGAVVFTAQGDKPEVIEQIKAHCLS